MTIKERFQFEPFPIPEEKLLERYEKLYTAAIFDVLCREVEIVLPSTIKPLKDGMKVAGIAFTVKGMPTAIDEKKSVNIRRAKMMEDMYKNSIVVWDTSGDNENAQYGEMMAAASMMRGCKGAIIDGGARDVDRILETGFKIWTRYTTPASMARRHKIIDWQIPIKIGNTYVNPGDVVFADTDGIIIIPRNLAYDTLLKAEEVNKKERGWREIIASGISPSEVVRRGGEF